jgi:hypothetical protein
MHDHLKLDEHRLIFGPLNASSKFVFQAKFSVLVFLVATLNFTSSLESFFCGFFFVKMDECIHYTSTPCSFSFGGSLRSAGYIVVNRMVIFKDN